MSCAMMGDKAVEISVMEAARTSNESPRGYDRPHQPCDLSSGLRKYSETYMDFPAMVLVTVLFIELKI